MNACVNDAPGQVAAERADHHRVNFDVVSRHDAEGAGKGERHDQAEQGLQICSIGSRARLKRMPDIL